MKTLMILIIIWYLIGAVGSSFVYYKNTKMLTIQNLLVFFTFGGLFGLFTFITGLIIVFGETPIFREKEVIDKNITVSIHWNYQKQFKEQPFIKIRVLAPGPSCTENP